MSSNDRSLRLVKLLLRPDVVRQMDQTIVAAGGAYEDRADFITEAVLDRVAEEAALRSAAIGRDDQAGKSNRRPSVTSADFVTFGSWIEHRALGGPAVPSGHVSFGLHNRDLPTLWAFDMLAKAASEVGGPVDWPDFVRQVGKNSVSVGEWLRLRDLSHERGVQSGTGFPKPGQKRAQSIERFIATMVGSHRRGDGPLFDLRLAVAAEAEGTLLPSEAGLAAMVAMVEGGLRTELPQPEAAFRAWWRHLSDWAPAEHEAWLRVLRALADAPNREALVARFPEWPGSQADTNTTGFVSRSREWGLVEPELIDGRYRLTAIGEAVAGEE